ncbi:SCF ubiquitin ligase subunit CulC like protein [Zymoseptoria brevis]|uniref:SCF ubiquitin ligase subunit CulC like protein n=1 Tax=Zymoseptoria brevis TaxID=1047168 RepID=A0A0F4GWF8_9PEZI|nr:SCF ubiquitin ligase subunit CulC like protein [Zymoseptoria brevis]
MASLAGRGRAKIRAPRRGLQADVDFETTWSTLERAFNEIHTKNASALSFEELYRNAYKIVLKKKGDELYNKVVDFEQTWLGQTVRPRIVQPLPPSLLLTDGSSKTLATASERRVAGESFLRALKQAWEEHQVCMGMLTDVLMYMDRVYCTDHRKPSIYAKSMGLFRDQILQYPVRPNLPSLLDILTSTILDQIQMDRDGDSIDKYLIKSNVYLLEGLYETDNEVEEAKLYLRAFEERFLNDSAVFYREEGERLLKESDAGTYCKHAKRRIDEEIDRCRTTLSETTSPRIQQVVEDELIRHKMKGLIEMDSGVQYMVDNDKFNELHLVYDLEARVDPRKPELTKAIQKIIADMGGKINNAAVAAAQAPPPAPASNTAPAVPGGAKQINQQTVAALQWVEDILELKDRFDRIERTSFNNDQAISTALTRSMGENINNFNRGSEYISLFIDDNMKKGIKDKTDVEVEQILEKAIILLRYLQDKDMFETYYKKHLCKRLLLNKSQSPEVEKQMISRMKMELGNSFTLKLEAMFKDMNLSVDLTNDYRKQVSKLGDVDRSRVDLNVNILTSMTWPLEAFRGGSEEENESKAQIIYAPALDRVRVGFERFYTDKHSGRKLTWQSNMGTVDMRAIFPKSKRENGALRTHEVNCSTYACLILLLFNDNASTDSSTTLTLEEIQAATNIPMSALTRNLQSLAVAPKTRLLTKEPMSREVKPSDRFSFNSSFVPKAIKITVNVVSAGNKVEGDSERKETEKRNNDSRAFAVEAAVVRIMKMRKTLSHAELLNETIGALNSQFKPDVGMIKKRIESLIEREYLARIEEAPVPSYRYLA